MAGFMLVSTEKVDERREHIPIGVVTGLGYENAASSVYGPKNFIRWATEEALKDIEIAAHELKADAVVGLRFNIQVGETVTVIASGTAVKLGEIPYTALTHEDIYGDY